MTKPSQNRQAKDLGDDQGRMPPPDGSLFSAQPRNRGEHVTRRPHRPELCPTLTWGLPRFRSDFRFHTIPARPICPVEAAQWKSRHCQHQCSSCDVNHHQYEPPEPSEADAAIKEATQVQSITYTIQGEEYSFHQSKDGGGGSQTPETSESTQGTIPINATRTSSKTTCGYPAGA